MKMQIENKFKFLSDTTDNELAYIINLIMELKTKEKIRKSLSLNIHTFDIDTNWFFYFGNGHLAVHQKVNDDVLPDRIIFVTF